jgi:hypothetical protein
VRKHLGKCPLGIPRMRWKDNIKMDLMEIDYEDGRWMELAQDHFHWRLFFWHFDVAATTVLVA